MRSVAKFQSNATILEKNPSFVGELRQDLSIKKLWTMLFRFSHTANHISERVKWNMVHINIITNTRESEAWRERRSFTVNILDCMFLQLLLLAWHHRGIKSNDFSSLAVINDTKHFFFSLARLEEKHKSRKHCVPFNNEHRTYEIWKKQKKSKFVNVAVGADGEGRRAFTPLSFFSICVNGCQPQVWILLATSLRIMFYSGPCCNFITNERNRLQEWSHILP